MLLMLSKVIIKAYDLIAVLMYLLIIVKFFIFISTAWV